MNPAQDRYTAEDLGLIPYASVVHRQVDGSPDRERVFLYLLNNLTPEQLREYAWKPQEEKFALWRRETSQYGVPNHERYGPEHDNWTRLVGKGRSQDQEEPSSDEELGDDSAEDSDD